MTDSAERFDVQPSVGNHFAWLRTLLALQRTLMASVRTSVAMIGFGFTVAKFFQQLQGKTTEAGHTMGPEVPRDLGLVLIAAGVISLMFTTWQYHHIHSYLRSGPFEQIAGIGQKAMHNSTFFVAFVVIAIGIAAFISIFARL